MKFAVWLAVSIVVIALVEGAALPKGKQKEQHLLAKRQVGNCLSHIITISQECTSFYDPDDPDTRLKLDTANDTLVAEFCKGPCARAFYNAYLECGLSGEAAVSLDLTCAKNAEGRYCGAALQTEYNVSTVCSIGNLQCTDECKSQIESVDISCCFYSYAAISYGSLAVNTTLQSCGIPNPGLCIGGFTNASIAIPSQELTDCQRSLVNLPQDCRNLLLNESIYYDADMFISKYCNDTCGQIIYDYYTNCELYDAADTLDYLCAENEAGRVCARVVQDQYSDLESLNADCADINIETFCTSQCLTDLVAGGCCADSPLTLSDPTVYQFLKLCGVTEDIGSCIGAFSNESIDFPYEIINKDYETCKDFSYLIPEDCKPTLESFSLSSYITVNVSQNFCKGECAKPIYKFYELCDKLTNSDTAQQLDFSCTINDYGTECLTALADESVQQTFATCSGPNSFDLCSDNCKMLLQKSIGKWGCCVNTLATQLGNAMFFNEEIENCKIENPGVCIGALSGEPLDGSNTDSPRTTDPSTKDPSTKPDEGTKDPDSEKIEGSGSGAQTATAVCYSLLLMSFMIALISLS